MLLLVNHSPTLIVNAALPAHSAFVLLFSLAHKALLALYRIYFLFCPKNTTEFLDCAQLPFVP